MKKKILSVVMLVLILCLLSSCGRKEQAKAAVTSAAQLQEPGRVIGVVTGTGDDQAVRNQFPNAELQILSDSFSGYSAVSGGKLDAYVFVKLQMELAIRRGVEGVRLLDETVGESHKVAVGISPSPQIPGLEEKINTFIEELRADGTLDDMYYRWVIENDDTLPDLEVPEHADLHLRVATSGVEAPFTYYSGTELTGYDIELARRFAGWLGAELEIIVYNYDGCIAAAQGGSVDCIMADLFVTPERAEAIHFSNPLFLVERGIVVADSGEAGQENTFWETIRSSFDKTFIREDRWQLFLSGIGTTLLITVLAILFGTALGFGVFLVCRNGSRAVNTLTRVLIRLVEGMPVVVLLMILYYIIFGRLSVSGTLVSVFAFTLVFGAAVFGMVRSGVGAVDRTQTEAAYALGYSDRRTFFRIILPQALPHFMPAYKGQITGLIKATAVVGYVAVQDLTKMGDIVRSRTYEAFFPLISVAAIYFILAAVLIFTVNRIEIRMDPKRRPRGKILKGIRTGDESTEEIRKG